VKKILFTMACGAMLVSCASKAAVIDSTMTEAKTLQALAKEGNLTVPVADSLIAAAEKQNSDGQSSQAFLLADEAILQLRLSMLELERKALDTEKKAALDSLAAAKEYLNLYSNVLNERKNSPKEQAIHH
jgi:hypothetical protein